MSFSTNIKNEISNLSYSRSESISELSAIFNISANIENREVTIYTENLSVARRIYKLIKDIYRIEITTSKEKLKRLNKNYLITIVIKENVDNILNDLSIINEKNKRLYVPDNYMIDSEEEIKAYLRGIFLVCGSINDPKTSRYHMEFIIDNFKTANFVNKLLNNLNYNSKNLKRDNHYVVYVKKSEKISDFIKLLNAYNNLFYYEDIRIYRDHKNMTNRLNNCEQANVEKIVNSSNELIKDIEKLQCNDNYQLLDEKIKELCFYKLKYKESSMQELADIISYETGKKISKSGVNHRIRKIRELVNKK